LKKTKNKTKNNTKTKTLAAIVALLIITVICWQASGINFSGTRDLAVNGLNVEAGIIDENGKVTPFPDDGSPLSLVKVNDAYPAPESYFYFRYWLLLKATGDISNAKVTAIHYTYTQKMNDAASSWVAGTEQSVYRPLTSPTETWLQVSLPVNTYVNAPLKYRDNYWYGEPTTMAPLSTKDTTAGNAIREARMDRVGDFSSYAPGTYKLQYICTVHSVDWQYTDKAGNIKTGTITPYPAALTSTINIQVFADGTLAAGLTGSST